jgi:hypothetical protein
MDSVGRTAGLEVSLPGRDTHIVRASRWPVVRIGPGLTLLVREVSIQLRLNDISVPYAHTKTKRL